MLACLHPPAVGMSCSHPQDELCLNCPAAVTVPLELELNGQR